MVVTVDRFFSKKLDRKISPCIEIQHVYIFLSFEVTSGAMSTVVDTSGDEDGKGSLFRSLQLRELQKLALTDRQILQGYCITAFFFFIGVLYIYAAFVSKFLPDTGNTVIDAVKYDQFFCYLVPLSILPTYAVIYLNWLAMKHFEQN